MLFFHADMFCVAAHGHAPRFFKKIKPHRFCVVVIFGGTTDTKKKVRTANNRGGVR
jgi:hypothetical protein